MQADASRCTPTLGMTGRYLPREQLDRYVELMRRWLKWPGVAPAKKKGDKNATASGCKDTSKQNPGHVSRLRASLARARAVPERMRAKDLPPLHAEPIGRPA